jgi:hypothetical protein
MCVIIGAITYSVNCNSNYLRYVISEIITLLTETVYEKRDY